MGRYYKVCTKSEARKKILDYWPNSNSQPRPSHKDDKDDCPDIIFVDFLQILKSQNNDAYVAPNETFDSPEEDATLKIPDKITFRELIVILTKTLYRILKLSDVYAYWKKNIGKEKKEIIVLYGIDKHTYVNPARSIVHTNRNYNTGKKPVCPELDIDGKMPDNWLELLDPVMGHRDKLISFLCFWMSVEMSTKDFRQTLSGKLRIIFDGHCITDEDIDNYGLALKHTGLGVLPPFSIFVEQNQAKMEWALEFNNTIGEADYLLYFYMKQMNHSNGTICADSYARDSDMVFLSVLFIDAQRHKTKKDYYRINVMKESIRSTPSWVSINALIHFIQKDNYFSSMATTTRPASQLMVCILAAGSDYTESHFSVNHAKFIDSYLENSSNIGPLFLYENGIMTLQGWQYVQMVCHAYALARGIVVAKSKGKEIEYSYVTKEISKKKIQTSRHMPTAQDMIWSSCQLAYYLQMISKLGQSDVDRMTDFDMGKYFYEKINDDFGFEYGNVKRKVDLVGFDERTTGNKKAKKN